jgi:hypothetical protein
LTDTLLYKIANELALLVHGDDAPSDHDWGAYVDALDRHHGRLSSVLVLADGPGPNAAQRARLNALVERAGRPVPTAVVTHSAVARGIVTVLHWFNPGIRAFAPEELAKALDYLAVEGSRRAPLKCEIAELRLILALGAGDAARVMPLLDTEAKLEKVLTERLRALRKFYAKTPPRPRE